MTHTAVLICPGRGTYNREELGYIAHHHADKSDVLGEFDALRAAQGQVTISDLDGAERFSAATHTTGDAASPLIFTASYMDAQSLADDIDVVAVTGNSMGWYTTLAIAGAVSPKDGFTIVNTMGKLMQDALIGGQLVYPFTDNTWRDPSDEQSRLMSLVADISAQEGMELDLSIALGGMLVLAGNAAGLDAFSNAVPSKDGRFPMRLPNHAAFHSPLQAPIAKAGRGALPRTVFTQPKLPMIDGRGHIWWPHASDVEALWDYPLGHQVTEPYEITKALRIAAAAFAPDLFIITGPGTTLGGAVAQSLVQAEWLGMTDKSGFQTRNAETPLLISMGMTTQRATVT